jgi:cytochrome c
MVPSLGAAAAQGTANQDGKIWAGVYTAAQAARGKAAFEASCAGCHNSDLSGDRGPALVGDRFLVNWETHNLSRLFTKLKDTMPANRPSSLPDEVYLDILTHLLQANAFPSGTEELKLNAESLNNFASWQTPQAIMEARLCKVSSHFQLLIAWAKESMC